MPTPIRWWPSLVVATVLVPGGVCRGQGTTEPLAAPRPTTASSAKEMGYAMGFQIGQQILAQQRQLGSPVDAAGLAAGLSDAVSGKQPRLEEQRLRAALAALEAMMRQKQQELVEKLRAAAVANRARGEEYLRKTAAEPAVKSLQSGLLYEVLEEGTGRQPAADDVVVVHFTGRHLDGTQFDGTDPSGPPAEIPLQNVVPGWREAVPMMKAGSKWRIHLPPELGYGEEGSLPVVEPNEVLVFDIEVVDSRPAGGE